MRTAVSTALAAALSAALPMPCSAMSRSATSACHVSRMTTPAFSTSAAAQQQPNHLLSIPPHGQEGSLRHTFFALRHGQSLANVANIISSDPKISNVKHGLSGFGHEQAKEAFEASLNEADRVVVSIDAHHTELCPWPCAATRRKLNGAAADYMEVMRHVVHLPVDENDPHRIVDPSVLA